MYPEPTGFTSWANTSYQYPTIATTGPDGFSTKDYNSWAYTPISEDDAALFFSTTENPSWSHYESSPWAPTVNPSSASPYSTMTQPPTAFSDSPWGMSDQTPLSAYSEPSTYSECPPLSRSVSADNHPCMMDYNTDYSPSMSVARMTSTAPASPGKYLGSDTASVSSQPKPRPKSKPTSKKSTAKSEKSSAKRKRNSKTPVAAAVSNTTTTEQDYEAQLLARFGPMMAPLSKKSHLTPSEQIRREAWRICKSEVMDMSQRSMKLLEHDHGALERETQKLQATITQLRDEIEQETRQLEVALTKVEKLSASN